MVPSSLIHVKELVDVMVATLRITKPEAPERLVEIEYFGHPSKSQRFTQFLGSFFKGLAVINQSTNCFSKDEYIVFHQHVVLSTNKRKKAFCFFIKMRWGKYDETEQIFN